MKSSKIARIVTDLVNGDAGKGSWVDSLVREYGAKYVVRFNGGSQAAHHVWTPEGIVHRFSQLGSAMFVPGTISILSWFMLIDPQYLLEEAQALAGKGVVRPLNRLIVSENAPIITPFNRLLNRIQELYRSGSRHGSCGYGIGITQSDVEQLGDRALYVRDLANPALVRAKLKWLQQLRLMEARPYETAATTEQIDAMADVDIESYVTEYCSQFFQRVRVASDDQILTIVKNEDTVWEGAQGVLLDQRFGTFPHVTRSNTTFQNALDILGRAGFDGQIMRYGLVRGYGTRHGAGPLPTEDDSLEVFIPPCDNATNPWQGKFRIGHFDATMVRYALKVVGGVDVLAVTNLDRMNTLPRIKVSHRYGNTDCQFFSATGEMLVPAGNDLDWLRQRTDALYRVVPDYMELPGWLSDRATAPLAYLEALSDIVGHRVHAYSITPGHRKHYLR